jgi:hypothetical protein
MSRTKAAIMDNGYYNPQTEGMKRGGEMRNTKTDPASYVVRYNGRYYVWYKTNSSGKAQLISADGTKFPGTPAPEKLEVIKPLYHKEFNGSMYFNTKQGVFSAMTGKKITHPKIIEMFEG